MTHHYPDLGSASDCPRAQPIRSTTQIWVVMRHQYGISALVSQTSFRGQTSGGVVKCRLFSQAGLLESNKWQTENGFLALTVDSILLHFHGCNFCSLYFNTANTFTMVVNRLVLLKELLYVVISYII